MKSTHGGKRAKAGRKPATDPKIGITIYLHTSVVKANGGTEEIKEVAVTYLNKRGKNK